MIPAGRFLSNALLSERGRRGRFHQHPWEDFLGELCDARAIFAAKSF
jgi:hypothetical protein